jgi:hypothetical protein
MPSGNHESLKSKIPKRKKARSNTPLSCKIKYYIKTNSAYFSGHSAFFTDDSACGASLRWVIRVDLAAREPFPLYPQTADMRTDIGFRR